MSVRSEIAAGLRSINWRWVAMAFAVGFFVRFFWFVLHPRELPGLVRLPMVSSVEASPQVLKPI